MKNPIAALLNKSLPYDGVDAQIARTFLIVMFILIFPILAMGGILFYSNFVIKAVSVVSLIPFSFFTIYLVFIGKMRAGLMMIVSATNLIISWICIVGFGIHDIAIIIYPTTILISSLVLRTKELWFVSFFAMFCIIGVGLGDYFGLYTPEPFGIGNEIDAVMTIILLSIGLITSSALSTKIRDTIKRERDETQKQEVLAEEIQQSIEEKTALFREVHHRVKNHLAFVNSLIDLEAMSNENIDKQKLKQLQTRVIAVARVHDHLYKSDTYETVNTTEYLEALISNFLITYKLSDTTTSFQLDDIELEVRKIIPLGISLHEIIHLIAKYGHSNPILNMHFILTKGSENIMTIICNQELSSYEEEGLEEIQLVNFMIEKTGGKLDLIKGKNKTLFEFGF